MTTQSEDTPMDFIKESTLNPIVETQGLPERTVDFSKRDAEIKKILHLTWYINNKFGGDDISTNTKENHYIDLDISNAVSKVLEELYTYMSRKKKSNIVNCGNDNKNKTVSIGTIVFHINDLYVEYVAQPDFVDFDYVIATPLVNMLTAFEMCYNEIQLSYSKFTTISQQKKLVENWIHTYHLSNEHIPLLTGITFQPKKRLDLMDTLGPLTLAIMLANENRQTKNKIKIAYALRKSIEALPMHKELVEVLKGKDNDIYGLRLCKILGDVLLFTGFNSTPKIYFPLLYIYKVLTYYPEMYKLFDFSDVEGFLFYNNTAHLFTWRKKYQGSPSFMSQVVFHSMFGTAVNDLGILSQTTTNEIWNNRKDVGIVFIQASKQESKQFTPILFTKVLRVTSAEIAPPYICRAFVSHGSALFSPGIYATDWFDYTGPTQTRYKEKFVTYRVSGYGLNPNPIRSFSNNLESLMDNLIELKELYTAALKNDEKLPVISKKTVWYKITDQGVEELKD